MTTPAGRPNLRQNIVAIYLSQAYVTLAGIVVVPLYLRYLGAEAFGLIGFFTILQSGFNLLDLGLTRTIGRETARFRANPADAETYRRLFHALQLIFVVIATAGAIVLVTLAGTISTQWLRIGSLDPAEVHLALQLMSFTVPLRWMSGLYGGVIVGSEKIVWMGAYNVAVATVRYGGAITAMTLFGGTPTVFFGYQLFVAVLALLAIVAMAYRQLPRLARRVRMGWSIAPVRPLVRFSMTIAGTAAISVLVTQTDKLLLSKLLRLDEYGTFSLGVLVAATVLLATAPIATPLMPRLTHMEARQQTRKMILLYHSATQLVCVLGFAIATTLAVFAEPILWAWTGNPHAAASAAPVLQLYAAGNAVLMITGMPFYLQYAKGDVRPHLFGSLIFIVVMVPALVLATLNFGMRGAGWVWLGSNLGYLLFWVPVMHHRLVPGLHLVWLGRNVAPIALAAGLTGAALWALAPSTPSRLGGLLVAGASGLVLLGVAGAASPAARSQLARLMGWQRGAAAPGVQEGDVEAFSSTPAGAGGPGPEGQTAAGATATASPAMVSPGDRLAGEADHARPVQEPMVSVCVMTYNQAPYIRACLDGLLAQSCTFPYEIVVGDDASTDGTGEIVADYARSHPGRIVALLHPRNLGPTRNYQAVHSAARGRFIAHMDGDDIAYPNKLQRLATLLEEHPECVMAVHDMDLVTRDGGPVGRTYSPGLPLAADLDYLVRRGAYFAHSAKMYRATARPRTLAVAPGEELLDLYIHIEHAAHGHIAGIQEPLGAYRLSSGVTAVRDWDEAVLVAHRKAIDHALDVGCSPKVVEQGRLRVEYRTAMKQLNRGNDQAFRQLVRLRGRQYLRAPWRHVLFSLLRNNQAVLDAYRRRTARRMQARPPATSGSEGGGKDL